MLAVDTPDTDWKKNKTPLKRKSPLRFGHRVIVPRPQIPANSLGVHSAQEITDGSRQQLMVLV